jgi:hypothetical protein
MERSGIDMVFKAAKKRYPFLVDWEFNLSEYYMSIAPITMTINQEMACEHYGYEKVNRFVSGFGSFSQIMDCDIETGSKLMDEIRNFFEVGYKMVPMEYCIVNELWDDSVKRLSVGLCYKV